MTLHQLPDGNWIKLSEITEITVIESTPENIPRLVVWTGRDRCSTIAMKDIEQATQQRDNLAEIVKQYERTVRNQKAWEHRLNKGTST